MSHPLSKLTECREIDLDSVFDVLSHKRYRQLLTGLYANGATAPVDDLAAELARYEERERGQTVERHRDELAVALRRTHLPALEARGVLTYDRQADTVRLKPSAQTHLTYHPEIMVDSRQWYPYYLLVGLAGLVLLGLTVNEVWVLDRASPPLVAGFVVLAFTALAGYHAANRRCYVR